MKIFKLLATVAIVAFWSFPALADIQYGGQWSAIQSNGFTASFQITQTGLLLNVAASYGTVRGTGTGNVTAEGTACFAAAACPSLIFRINWDNGASGEYTGQLGGDGYLRGTTADLNTNNGSVGWISSRTFNSMYEVYFTPGDCDFRHVTAKLEIGGIVRYDVVGTCLNQPMTGKMLYIDGSMSGFMQEVFYYNGVQWNVFGKCRTDPWVSGAPCAVEYSNPIGGTGRPLDNYHVDFQRYPAPLSLRVIHDPTIFQTALAKAPHPSPPARPVNTKVQLDIKNRAVVNWLAPDENPPYGPYETFSVEGLPYQGGTWVLLGTAKRHKTEIAKKGGVYGMPIDALFSEDPVYRLSVQIPTSRTGIVESWKFRACTKTRFTQTCSDPITPLPFGIKESMQIHAPVTRQPPPGVKQSTQMNAPRTAARLGGSDTLNAQKVLPTIQQPSAIPQSSPPKVLPGLSPSTSTTLNGRFFPRGVPQEDAAPAEPKPPQ
jgi:hypothetical protein